MYTTQQKRETVERFLSSGLTISAASRLEGYPERHRLASWLREAREGSLVVTPTPAPGRVAHHVRGHRYPPETVEEALRLRGLGYGYGTIARRLGLSSAEVPRSWWRREHGGGTVCERSARRGAARRGAGRAAAVADARDERIAELELQVSVLKELMRDPKAGDPARLSNRRKTELGERLRRERGLSLRWVLTFFRISRSSYSYHRARLGRPSRDERLARAVSEAFGANGGRLGYRATWAELRRRGTRVSEKVVRRVMRSLGLRVVRARSDRPWSSYDPAVRVAAPDVLRRDFSADRPNLKWVTDVTEFRVPAGKLYLSPVIDLYDLAPVAWSISESPDHELTESSLARAVATLAPGERPVLHHDRGAHYGWPGWLEIERRAGLVRSASRKGRCGDNAACEGFFGRMKLEMFHGRDWSGVSLDELASEVDAYMRWFRDARPKARLGWLSPAESRRALGLAPLA